jgi:hypothetical protein
MSPLETIALAGILTLSPLDRAHERLPGWDETTGQRASRYERIAVDVARAATDACREPHGPNGEASPCERRSVALLVGIAWHESDMAPDVDAGLCYRGRDGRSPRCDGGAAVSIWQLRTGGEERRLFESVRYEAARRAAAASRELWRAVVRAMR